MIAEVVSLGCTGDYDRDARSRQFRTCRYCRETFPPEHRLREESAMGASPTSQGTCVANAGRAASRPRADQHQKE